MKCNRSIGITGESSNFRRSATSVYRSARLLFTVGIRNDRGYPVALGRVNLSRAPHCPAAFSFGNEVMETRLDLPFLRRTTYNFTPSFFLALSPCLAFAGFPSSVLSFYSACHRPHPGSPQSYYVRCFVDELRLQCLQRVQWGELTENSYLQIVSYELYTSYILDFSAKQVLNEQKFKKAIRS